MRRLEASARQGWEQGWEPASPSVLVSPSALEWRTALESLSVPVSQSAQEWHMVLGLPSVPALL